MTMGRPAIRLATREDQGDGLVKLLDAAFPDTFDGRTYFKQQPHSRLLAHHDDRLVGQVGLEFRVINVGGALLEICGIVDLCVAHCAQRRGIGSQLLVRAEELAVGRDFMVLIADNQSIYHRYGYSSVTPAPARWHAIEDLQSHSVIEEDLGDCFMIKQIGSKPWPEGKIDMLGYLF